MIEPKIIMTNLLGRPVAKGGLGGCSPPVCSRTVNPISTRGSRLCPPQYYKPPGFSDLATALLGQHYFLLLQ